LIQVFNIIFPPAQYQKKDLTGGGGRDRIEVRHEEENVMVLD
jgi:hypothetical protein